MVAWLLLWYAVLVIAWAAPIPDRFKDRIFGAALTWLADRYAAGL